MKIALVAPINERIPPRKYGGIGRIVNSLANGLTNKGHIVTLLGPGDSKTNARLIPIFLKSIGGLKSFQNDPLAREAYFQSAVSKIVAILQEQKFDVVNNHLGWRLVPFHKILSSPLITTLHTPLDESNKQITFTEHRSAPFISVSKNQRKPLPKLNYAATIYNGIELDLYNFSLKHDGYFVFLGRMSPEKGVLEAIRIAKKLRVKLILAGAIEGWNRQYFNLKIKPLIDNKQIIFIGEVTDQQKNKLLGRAKALLAPIQCNESFGLTLVEAMACGTPAVVFARGSAEEIIIHKKTGFIAHSIDQMVKYCRTIDMIKREDCRDRALQFSAQKMVDEYEKVFLRLMSSKKYIGRSTSSFLALKIPRGSFRDELPQIVTKVQQPIGFKQIPELDARLAGMKRIFRAPPLTPKLVAAIKLISPHCNFTATEEKYRYAWEADQNGACWGEYEALAHLFRTMPKPTKILEIGPGVGRSLVFFSKKFGWKNSEIHAYEGEGGTTKYTILGPRYEDSYCGNISALRYVLKFNGIRNVTVFNSKDVRLAGLPGSYDLIYSFYGIGFHWSLEYFLDDLLPLLHNRSVAIFTVPQKFRPFPKLENLSYRIVNWKTAWPKDGWLKLLILSKSVLPN